MQDTVQQVVQQERCKGMELTVVQQEQRER